MTGYRSETNLIKQTVYDHGPTTMAFWYDDDYQYDDDAYGTVYDCDSCQQANHLVSIIGWDDSVPQPNSGRTGAWLVKNSWGTDWGDAGYFWLAYDSSCMTEIAYLTYEDYDPDAKLLYWDEAGHVNSLGYFLLLQTGELYDYSDPSAWMANVYTPERDSVLTSVEFWTTDDNVKYEIYVYRDGDPSDGLENLVTSQSGTSAEYGYYSIGLDDPVLLYADQPFTIAAKMTTDDYDYPIAVERLLLRLLKGPEGSYFCEPPIQIGVSFVRHEDTDPWADLAYLMDDPLNACLRAKTSSPPAPVPVGGIIVPVSRLELLAPWVGLASLMAVVIAAVVVRRRIT